MATQDLNRDGKEILSSNKPLAIALALACVPQLYHKPPCPSWIANTLAPVVLPTFSTQLYRKPSCPNWTATLVAPVVPPTSLTQLYRQPPLPSCTPNPLPQFYCQSPCPCFTANFLTSAVSPIFLPQLYRQPPCSSCTVNLVTPVVQLISILGCTANPLAPTVPSASMPSYIAALFTLVLLRTYLLQLYCQPPCLSCTVNLLA